MGSLSTLFKFGGSSDQAADGLPEIFAMSMPMESFVRIDVQTMYQKILTDVMERTQGLEDDQEALLWDNCVKSESSDGLLTMIAKAMYEKTDLFLVFDKTVNVIRRATGPESAIIRDDYEKKAESSTGIFITFKNFLKNDMIKLYSAFEYYAIASLNKNMNLSKSVQYKINGLRAAIPLINAADAKVQAQVVWKNLGLGKDVYIDSEDKIETAQPDLEPLEKGLNFLNQRRAFYLGLTESYITGIQTSGLNTTGEADRTAIERGLKAYYFSIIKPVLEALFDASLTYKSQDYRQITQALEALKTFNLVDNNMIGEKTKRTIIEGLLDVDPDDNDWEEAEEPVQVDPITGLPLAKVGQKPGEIPAKPGQKPKAVPDKKDVVLQ